MRALLRYVRWWALAGLVGPALTYLEAAILDGASGFTIFLWPSGIATMALEKAPWSIVVVASALLVAINVLTYAGAGAVVWIARAWLRPDGSEPAATADRGGARLLLGAVALLLGPATLFVLADTRPFTATTLLIASIVAFLFAWRHPDIFRPSGVRGRPGGIDAWVGLAWISVQLGTAAYGIGLGRQVVYVLRPNSPNFVEVAFVATQALFAMIATASIIWFVASLRRRHDVRA